MTALKAAFILLCGIVVSQVAFGQSGDKPGEVQKVLVPEEKIPPAPILSPAESLKSFKLQPGFRIEVVAAEPLVTMPVAAQWDGNGKLWVLEMNGFMPNPEGKGEDEPVGKIVMLEDTDSNGKMDKRHVIIDKLVMARAFLVLHDGVLVAEPPMLWWYPLHEGKVGNREEISRDYAKQADPALGTRANPEHAANSLTWGMDNWIYSANYTRKFKKLGAGEFIATNTLFRGQWGFSFDDLGRLVFNSNSDQLRIDLVPSDYLTRNPNYRGAQGGNVDPVKNQAVWPIRVTPGINRGYQQAMLRADGTLAKFTAACSPMIYRGNNFPAEFYGNAFVCEPSAHLIKRNILQDKDGVVTGRHAYAKEEFLASTDERFRPVNLYTGPDGAMYILDMYQGIIQHRYFLTTYLRKQAESRGLDKGGGHGRIYRVVYEKSELAKQQPALETASASELVKALSHTNGWWRDTAQRLLVERRLTDAVPALEELVKGDHPLAAIHALWTLDGLEQLRWRNVEAGLNSKHPEVVAVAVRHAEQSLREDPETTLKALEKIAGTESNRVLTQLALSLGASTDPGAQALMLKVADRGADNVIIRDAIITGLTARELPFLEALLNKSDTESTAIKNMASALAKAVMAQNRAEKAARLLELAANGKKWQTLAILDGMTPPLPPRGRPPTVKPVVFTEKPKALTALSESKDTDILKRLQKMQAGITWPGLPNYVEPPKVIPLSAKEKELFEKGKELYVTSCGACHQPHGYGQEGLAPPLVDSEWVSGPVDRLGRIVLHGVRGPMTVKGQKWDMEMPGLAVFDDEQLASLVTYIRREWGHTFSPVSPETIGKIRKETGERAEAWTERELLKVK